jgi:hypothetical protein
MKALATLLPAVAMLMATGNAEAAGNPREPRRTQAYAEPVPVTDPEEIADWLVQLAGRYSVEGSVFMLPRTFDWVDPEGNEVEIEFTQRLEQVRGMVDCENIGTGGGVQCILNIRWQEQFETIIDPYQGPPGVYNLAGGAADLSPAMTLIGLDPAKQGVTFLLVNSKGLPEGGPGKVAVQKATLRTPCVNAPTMFQAMNPVAKYNDDLPRSCERILIFEPREEGKGLWLTINSEINRELATSTRLTLKPVKDDKDASDKKKRR